MMPTKIRIGIVGATGYTGAELVRLLSSHPNVEIAVVTSGRHAGEPLSAHCPWLDSELVLSSFDPASLDVDAVFLCQESGFALHHAAELAHRMRVIDLSADFRLKDADAFRAAYGLEPATLPKEILTVYGLPEIADHASIREAHIIANAGCHVAASTLALNPFAKAGLVSGTPVIDTKTGVSGAGRSRAETAYLFSELDGSVSAYKITGHRHIPEIEQNIGLAVRFTPHLVPVPRGLHATIQFPSACTDPISVLERAYESEPFVRVVHTPPQTKHVLGSNRCDVYATHDPHTGFVIAIAVLDNLVKGASGNAIQNLNLAFGLPETAGLPIHGLWP
jgi:N-acetyl-gamma-glutamyl-phosphate reductase